MCCNVCFDENIKTNVCFHNCSYNVCDECIFHIIKVGKCVTYKCPQCREISEFDFSIKSPFGIYCNINSVSILKKYSEKYKTTDSEEEVFTPIRLLGTFNPLFEN